MGGGSLPNTITFQQNPPRVFNDPLGGFPIFTKESFNQWITDISNSSNPGDSGFTEASLNYLVSFDSPWQVIGTQVLKDLSNIDISNGQSLTDIFHYNEALTDICSSAFENMGLSGGLDFIGFSALETIGSAAFYENNISSVNFNGLTGLNTIGSAAFYENNLSSVNFNGLTALHTIGSVAFTRNSLSSVNFNGLTALHTIGAAAFSENNLSSVNFNGLTALHTIEDGAFGINIITDISIIDCPSLTDISQYAFILENPFSGSLTFRNVPSLKAFPHNAIPTASFEGSLELTGTGFTEIGDFSNGSFTGSLKINDNQDLSSINENAFYDNSFTSLELSGNPSLTTIEPFSFYVNNFSQGVTFTNCPSLQIIGKDSFHQSTISGELDFSGLESLTDICNGAFSSNNLNARVKFGNNSKLQILDNNSLQSCQITGLLDLSPLTALTKIGKKTFRNNSINDKVIFENCLSLNLIDERAFDAAGISGEVDFSGIGALTISYEAFIKNPNITQYVFNDNSGTIIGINVDPSMNGVPNTGTGPGLTWDNSGFDISSNGEYIFVKQAQVVVS